MANHGQLTRLTADQRTDFESGLGRIHCELVKISWPSPDGVKFYSWENWLADPVYATPLTTFLAGAPLIPAFVPGSREQRFHSIPQTSAIGDDVVTMRFANTDRTIETLIRTHGSGVKVEFYWFFPEVDGGTAVNWFLGYLRTPSGHGAINKDFITLTAASGFRTANMVIPNLSHPQQCPVRFGGQMTFEELKLDHPCTYNRHLSGANQTSLGGAKGLLNGAAAFADCPHTEQGCLDRFGHTLVYMGVRNVTETVPVGAGEHKTYSTTRGRYGSLSEPSSVVYGEREVTGVLLDYRRETNPSPDHPEAGTLVTLFEFGLGPVESVTDFQLTERTPQGIDYRLGEQEQTATVYSPNVPSLNRRVVANLNHNPIDPTTVQVEQIKATCHMVGRNTVRVYTDQDTWTEQQTSNRAWCLLELLESTWFGARIDRARLLISDFIYLAGKQSTFNCQVTARTAQQQIQDICESANWFLPFHHEGVMRFLPMEELDTTASDIPTFTDAGANRNIVVNNGISTLTLAYKDDDEIPNRVILQFDDAEHRNITRPLVFEDWDAQAKAGDVYGDNTKRVVEKTYTAYGVTSLTEAVALGASLRDIGPFGNGGLMNNLEITFVTRPAIFHEALELHVNKAIKVESTKLDGYEDPNGDPFEYFIIKRLERTADADLIVTAQAYSSPEASSACSGAPVALTLCPDHDEPSAPYTAVSFDSGNSVYILTEDLPFPHTITFWVKIDNVQAGEETVFLATPIIGAWPYFVGTANDGKTLRWWNGSSSVTGTELSAGTWYHVAITAASGSGGARNIYLNGVLDITSTGNETTDDLYISCGLVPGNNNLDGDMCAVKVWNTILTTDEIAAEMDAYGPCKTSNLWAWWPMYSQPTGYFDFSDNCRDLTTEGSKSTAASGPAIDFYCTIDIDTTGYVVWNTPNDAVVDGEFGADTEITGTVSNMGATGVTWANTIDPDDVIVDRWVHTIDELPAANSYNVWHDAAQIGFKIWYDGSGWIYHQGGIDTTTFGAGELEAGDTLTVEYDSNSGSAIRRYKHNGVTVRTDTTSVTPLNAIQGITFVSTGIHIGPVYWQVYVCAPSDEQEEGETGGGTTTGDYGFGYGEYGLEGYGE